MKTSPHALLLATAPAAVLASSSYVLPIQHNPHFAPATLDLVSGTVLKFGLFKHAAKFPALRANVKSAIPQSLLAEHGVGGKKSSSLKQRKRRVGLDKRGLLGLDLDLGLGLDLNSLLSLGVGVNVDTSAHTVIDTKWNGATTTRLTNSQNDNAVRSLVCFASQ